MNFEIILLDVDDTLLNFKAAEDFAFEKTHRELSVGFTKEDFDLYKTINVALWKQMEAGEVNMAFVRKERWVRYCEARHLSTDPHDMHVSYEDNLSKNAVVFDDGVEETLRFLKERARIYTVTNGIKEIQIKRLKACGLDKYFDGYFISECIGHTKPCKEFFDHVIKNIPDFSFDDCLLVGDSTTTDMQAKKYGFNCCLIDRSFDKLTKCDPKPDFVIYKFSDLLNYYI